jgi:2-oxoglutarate ferredoxin oxidoreductase subunit alpha
MQQRLKAKIEAAVAHFTFFDWHPAPSAKTLIITYGVTARAAREAIRQAPAPVSLLVLKTLWPVPEALIRQKAAGVDHVLVPEMNLGQYIFEIERILPEKRVLFLGRMDGELITPSQLQAALQEVLAHD